MANGERLWERPPFYPHSKGKEIAVRVAEKYALASAEVKAQMDAEREEYRKRQREKRAIWWDALTDEQRVEHGKKISAGRKVKEQKSFKGPAKGEGHYRSKLTEAIAREIHASDLPAQELADKYGINVSTVRSIWSGETWSHLKLPERTHKDFRRKEKKAEPATPPRISKELKEEVLAHPWMDTHQLAQQLGLHYMDVATIRMKHNGVYRKCL